MRRGAEEVCEALVEGGELGEDVDVGDEGPVFLEKRGESVGRLICFGFWIIFWGGI